MKNYFTTLFAKAEFKIERLKVLIPEYLSKLIPAQDKLKHFYLGSLVFALLNLFTDSLTSVVIVFAFAWAWELYQKSTGGTNSIKEIMKDIFFGILVGILVAISSAF